MWKNTLRPRNFPWVLDKNDKKDSFALLRCFFFWDCRGFQINCVFFCISTGITKSKSLKKLLLKVSAGLNFLSFFKAAHPPASGALLERLVGGRWRRERRLVERPRPGQRQGRAGCHGQLHLPVAAANKFNHATLATQLLRSCIAS